MIRKYSLIPVFVAVVALVGCGGNDQQTVAGSQASPAASAVSPAVEVTTAVTEDQIKPVSSEILSSAQWTGAGCSLDSVDGNYSKDQVKLIKGKPHVFRGWLLGGTKRPAASFRVVLKGAQNFAISATTGVERKDVGEFFKDPSLASAGFNFSSNLNSIPAGEYSVTFLIEHEQHSFFCDAGKKLTIE
jgi:hypothetical protein